MKRFVFTAMFIVYMSIAATAFGKQMHVGYGISIDIPNDWVILPIKETTAIDRAEESLNKGSEETLERGTLLVANTKEPIVGIARVSVDSSSDSQEEFQKLLLQASNTELESIDKEMYGPAMEGLKRIGVKIIKIFPARVCKLGGQVALEKSYLRNSPDGRSSGKVSSYVMFKDGYAVRVMLSYDSSQESTMKPIIEQIYKSIHIQ